jgi:sec-independent protein translocase protein TatA
MQTPYAIFASMFGGQDLLLLLVIGVLLFGRKLPELGRSLGKTVTEVKKGLRGIEDDMSEPSVSRPESEPKPVKAPTNVTPLSAPKFEDAPAPTNAPPRV